MSGYSSHHPSLDDPNAWVPYRYHPTKIGASIFIALFAITSILHLYQIVRNRTWYFIPLLLGGAFEIVGYIGRVLSADDIWALGPYIVQAILILVAPALFAASIYIVLGRIILAVDGEQYSLIRRKWLTKLFVSGDVVSFGLQAGGGGIQAAGTLNMFNIGEKVIIAGLFVQLVFFGSFMIVSAHFHHRFVTRASTTSLPLDWKRHILALYAGSVLIMVRSIFRVVEYLMGNDGYLLRHEYFFYIFDATLMFFVMVLFNWIHPREITEHLPPKRTTRASNGGRYRLRSLSNNYSS